MCARAYAVTVTSLSREGTNQHRSQFCVKKKADDQIASIASDSSVCSSKRNRELTNLGTLLCQCELYCLQGIQTCRLSVTVCEVRPVKQLHLLIFLV